jgi:signal transduction histidine kinase
MTIKRRMIATNISLIVVPVVLCAFAEFLIRVITFFIFDAQGLPFPDKVESARLTVEPWMYLFFLGQMALITGIFFASNMFFTRRLIGQIMAEHEKYENNRRELIAGISHDLRTPLTSIKAYIEGIETGVASTPEKQRQYFATIKSKTGDLEHIINQLFLFSKLDIGEFPMNMQSIDIGRTVTDMLGELTDEYARRGLSIELTQTVENVFVNANYLQLRNVIINVLENSVKYTDGGKGTVSVNCSVVDSIAEIALTDNGPGVPTEALDKLFDVFYRADPSRNNEKKGSGLGLAIAEKTIRHMGGTIHAELPKNGGLAIVIRLPIVQGKG